MLYCTQSIRHCVIPENILTPPWRVFWFEPPPLWNSSLGWYFPLKILAFETSLPLGISNDPLGWDMDIFWNHTFAQGHHLTTENNYQNPCKLGLMLFKPCLNTQSRSQIQIKLSTRELSFLNEPACALYRNYVQNLQQYMDSSSQHFMFGTDNNKVGQVKIVHGKL